MLNVLFFFCSCVVYKILDQVSLKLENYKSINSQRLLKKF